MLAKMTHIAMRVADSELKEAERFYSNLFDMKVAFRETMTSDGWATLPDENGWEYAEKNGLKVGLVMIYADEFAIDLESQPVPPDGGRYSHTGVLVEPCELQAKRSAAENSGCNITYNSDSILVFDDPYGMRWEFMTLSYEVPAKLSAGEREGRWAEDLVPA